MFRVRKSTVCLYLGMALLFLVLAHIVSVYIQEQREEATRQTVQSLLERGKMPKVPEHWRHFADSDESVKSLMSEGYEVKGVYSAPDRAYYSGAVPDDLVILLEKGTELYACREGRKTCDRNVEPYFQ